MAVLTTGAEFKKFYNDDQQWPEGVWHEDEVVEVDGANHDFEGDTANIADTAKVRIADGVVYGTNARNDPSFESYFKAWRRKQTTRSLAVECDVANFDAVVAAIKGAGGKVL